MDKDLKNKSLEELGGIISSFSEKSYVAKVIFQWIHKHDISDIDDITSLSQPFRKKLEQEGWHISNLKKEKVLRDKDGTSKYIFELEDDNIIETVLLKDKKDKEERLTLCISCQVGCRMRCAFCATGRLSYKRNLTAGEIVDQIIQIEKDTGQRIHNVVFMGMGEPFDNYDDVLKAARILNNEFGKNIGARRITISTCGVVSGIKKLAGEKMQVRLAVSLNSVCDDVRNKIMPISRTYSISQLRQAIRFYRRKTGRRITIEYLLIKGINDTKKDLDGLLRFLRNLDTHINLIEYNEFFGSRFETSSREAMALFKETLAEAGYEVACRYKRGRGIRAACGQLGA